MQYAWRSFLFNKTIKKNAITRIGLLNGLKFLLCRLHIFGIPGSREAIRVPFLSQNGEFTKLNSWNRTEEKEKNFFLYVQIRISNFHKKNHCKFKKYIVWSSCIRLQIFPGKQVIMSYFPWNHIMLLWYSGKRNFLNFW